MFRNEEKGLPHNLDFLLYGEVGLEVPLRDGSAWTIGARYSGAPFKGDDSGHDYGHYYGHLTATTGFAVRF